MDANHFANDAFFETDALFEAELSRMELPDGGTSQPAAGGEISNFDDDNEHDDQSSGGDSDDVLFDAALSQMELPAATLLPVRTHGGSHHRRNEHGRGKKRPRPASVLQQLQSQNHRTNALPPPSEEQQAVIDAVLSGHCVSLPSVAGSGKTTCMLQIATALPPNRTVIIITYNRALSDECKERVLKCGLASRVRAYTIHGLVTYVSGRTCNDDSKLRNIVTEWNQRGVDISTTRGRKLSMDLVLLDEAQDLRPLFYSAICHILKAFSAPHDGRQSVQICLVGDPKQMLYDFPTYGNDKASLQYMEQPEQCWGAFTVGRTWVRRQLTVSYRLTPNIASFVNAIWGTSIKGGNNRVENLPVEYHCKYPYPASKSSEERYRLSTDFLDSIIKEHGPENVLFLAQSVKNERCPIRVHVNALCEMRNRLTGEQIHNFHIKESLRGFESNNDVKNKVRVWTFCGSKGCEADVVVLFGLDMLHGRRVHSLNQIGVALSRARKRLIVIHGMSFSTDNGKPNLEANPYYPLLGDSPRGTVTQVASSCSGRETLHLYVPPYVEGDRDMLRHRSGLTRTVMQSLSDAKIVCVADNCLPDETNEKEEQQERVVYIASEFSYFSADAETRFLNYAKWTKEAGITARINYTVGVQFKQTTEDVSALYGEALTYMLQWELDGFCPNVETIINDGIIQICPTNNYYEATLRKMMIAKKCEKLSAAGERLLRSEFDGGQKAVQGKALIRFLNTRIIIRKKRMDGERTIYFRVKAIKMKSDDEDNMTPFLDQIRSVYNSSRKTPAQWVYLANAVMAFSNYVEKFYQIGTSPASYNRWVESSALCSGLSRLMHLMEGVPSYSSGSSHTHEVDDGTQGNIFEGELGVEFSPDCHILDPTKSLSTVIGIQGICDWIGRGLSSPKGAAVDLLEIKFINELCNMHRLQVLTYCALHAVERGQACSGMLYNARTGELEVCRIESSVAENFLLDIAQFKFNGQRHPRQAGVKDKENTCKIVVCLLDDELPSKSNGDWVF